MVDEKLDDQVWVTVVATGFAEDGRRARRRLNEPAAGELKVARAAPAGAPAPVAPRRPGGGRARGPRVHPEPVGAAAALRMGAG